MYNVRRKRRHPSLLSVRLSTIGCGKAAVVFEARSCRGIV